MVSSFDLVGLVGAALGLVFGALLGARWGVFGALAGALGGAVAGLCGGFFFMACVDSYGNFIHRIRERHRVLGTVLLVLSMVIFVVILCLLGSFAIRFAVRLIRSS